VGLVKCLALFGLEALNRGLLFLTQNFGSDWVVLVKCLALFGLEALKRDLLFITQNFGSDWSFTSEADKLKAGQTREGIQKTELSSWQGSREFMPKFVTWQTIWLVSNYLIVIWHVTRQGALTYDVRISLFDWLVFGAYAFC